MHNYDTARKMIAGLSKSVTAIAHPVPPCFCHKSKYCEGIRKGVAQAMEPFTKLSFPVLELP